MRIFIIERDIEEIDGMMWYLKTYIAADLYIKTATNCADLGALLEQFQPQLLLIEMELITSEVEELLKQQSVPIIALTAEPIFQQAMKAIRIQAIDLFVKPVPLEQLKSTILALLSERALALPQQIPLISVETTLYSDLYLNRQELFSLHTRAFFLIECAQFKHNLALYEWLIHVPIFMNLTVLPLQNRIICLADCDDLAQLSKQLRLLMQEWAQFNDDELNIAIYDGDETTLFAMYQACKRVLTQRFYKGYSHLFKSSQSLQLTRLDPLLTPEQQQLWITSLESGDLKTIKAFLYQLTNAPPFYHYEDVRIHLTSVLAQIRRFMLKYHLQQQAPIEERYRALFHQILEHPILYAIVQEFILFTHLLIDSVKKIQQHKIADYTEQAISYIEEHYKNSELTLQAVARNLNISANYLSNVFSKKRGIPFKKFLQQYRVQQAATLLLETDYSVATIAETVGFIDSNYFIKVFRDYYKITPYRYRAQVKKPS